METNDDNKELNDNTCYDFYLYVITFFLLEWIFLALPCKKFSTPLFLGVLLGYFSTQSRPMRRYFTKVLTRRIVLKFLPPGHSCGCKPSARCLYFFDFLLFLVYLIFSYPRLFLLFLFVLQRVEIPVQ